MSCYRPVNVMVNRISAVPGGARVGACTPVPCGKCLGCREKQARDWSFRLIHEAQMHDSAFFVTLTYDRLPLHGSLEPEEFQKWMKRVRRRHAGRVSYYGCGEYGDESQRPHYHAVLIADGLFLDRQEIGRRGGYKIYESEMLRKTWKHGFVELQAMSRGAAAYVAGYVRKKMSKLDSPDHYTRVVPETAELVEIEPEFSRMSRRPAIGQSWIRKYWRDVYPRDFIPRNGFEFRPPRYYDKWMDTDHGGDGCDCDEHREVMNEVRDKRWEELYELTPAQLEAKEVHHRKKVNLFQSRGAI